MQLAWPSLMVLTNHMSIYSKVTIASVFVMCVITLLNQSCFCLSILFVLIWQRSSMSSCASSCSLLSGVDGLVICWIQHFVCVVWGLKPAQILCALPHMSVLTETVRVLTGDRLLVGLWVSSRWLRSFSPVEMLKHVISYFLGDLARCFKMQCVGMCRTWPMLWLHIPLHRKSPGNHKDWLRRGTLFAPCHCGGV